MPSSNAQRTTAPPPGPRGEMPTLVDDVELESARLASMRDDSAPPPPAPTVAPAPSPEIPAERPSASDIEVLWAPESEQLEPEELFAKYVRLLGAFTRIPYVTVPFDQLPTLSLDSRMGFLIALIDGGSSIQTLLDVASMPPREVLHALVTLRDLGIVRLRDA